MPCVRRRFDCDNGGECLNHHLLACLHERKKPVAFTRSRPYHRDDHAHVEQKNWLWPRPLLGYDRLERAQLVAPICARYQKAWSPPMNCCLPRLKLKAKGRERSQGKMRCEPAHAADQRLRDAGVLNR